MNEEQDFQAALIAEQLRHTLDLLKGELRLLQSDTRHASELTETRLARLEAQAADFETRLRTLTDAATQFRLLAGLATGGGLLSLVALLRELAR
jgi:hypothetical protein